MSEVITFYSPQILLGQQQSNGLLREHGECYADSLLDVAGSSIWMLKPPLAGFEDTAPMTITAIPNTNATHDKI